MVSQIHQEKVLHVSGDWKLGHVASWQAALVALHSHMARSPHESSLWNVLQASTQIVPTESQVHTESPLQSAMAV